MIPWIDLGIAIIIILTLLALAEWHDIQRMRKRL